MSEWVRRKPCGEASGGERVLRRPCDGPGEVWCHPKSVAARSCGRAVKGRRWVRLVTGVWSVIAVVPCRVLLPCVARELCLLPATCMGLPAPSRSGRGP